MNKVRRQELNELVGRLECLQADLDNLREEEADYRDNMPENLQGSERYERADEAVMSLDSALDDIQSAIDSILEAVE